MHGFTYENALAASEKVRWRIEDIIGEDKTLDFSTRFMPESLARVEGLSFLSPAEARLLNQIRGHEYLRIFALVEEFIIPFALEHAHPDAGESDARRRALLVLASDEAKHIDLFKRFAAAFEAGFGAHCDVIGPPEAVAAEVLRHDPMAVALVVLHIEWMVHRHYVESVRDANELDPLFKSLVKHHWLDEIQHAQIDTLLVDALAADRDEAGVAKAIDEYLEIGMFLDEGLKQQTAFNLEAFERATGRALTDAEREEFMTVQHQAARWTYLGSGMSHPQFTAAVGRASKTQQKRLAEVVPAFS